VRLGGAGKSLENKAERMIMRPSIKRTLTGLLVAGALAYSAAGAYANNANGPDAFIGIVGGNPGATQSGIPYNEGRYQGGGYQANTGHGYYGTYNGGYYHGY
jgi:hypothetical protein